MNLSDTKLTNEDVQPARQVLASETFLELSTLNCTPLQTCGLEHLLSSAAESSVQVCFSEDCRQQRRAKILLGVAGITVG